MISAKELQLGDWVLYHGRPARVRNIHDNVLIDGDDEMVDLVFPDRTTMPQVDPIHLEPIPLTAEILEKNEFEMGSSGNYWFSNEDEGLEITFFPKGKNYTNGAYDFVDIYKGCLSIIELPVGFVHELQHALRLCGIDKEIEL